MSTTPPRMATERATAAAFPRLHLEGMEHVFHWLLSFQCLLFAALKLRSSTRVCGPHGSLCVARRCQRWDSQTPHAHTKLVNPRPSVPPPPPALIPNTSNPKA
eukprot:2856365-Rhodomonas_salina.1